MIARLFVVLLVAAGAVACQSPCMQVQQVMCACIGRTQNERTTCEDTASLQEGLVDPDEAAFARCEALLPGCEALLATGCEKLDTAEGRVACGIAEP